jgi:hypothetical protein
MLKIATALSLMRDARRRSDVDAGIGRTAVALFASWLMPALVLRRGDRIVEADPESLGFVFEDTKWMWWWIRTQVKLPVYTAVYVRPRQPAKREPGFEMGPAIASGDDAFDAHFVAERHSSMPECDETAKAILESARVRSLIGELVSDRDDITIGSHVSLTRQRKDASFDEVVAHMEKVAALADAMEAVFAGTNPYR